MANTNVPAVWDGAVTEVQTSAQGPLYKRGQYREEDGKGFRYYEFNDGAGNLTLAATEVLYYIDATDHTCTSDLSDTDINHAAGIAVSVVANGGFGWMQVYGHDTVKTDGADDITDGDAIIGGGDGTCNSVAQNTAPTNKVIGWATADDVDGSNTVTVFLTLS